MGEGWVVSLGFLAALTSSPASCLRLITLRSGRVGAGTAGVDAVCGDGAGMGIVGASDTGPGAGAGVVRRRARSRTIKIVAM